MRDRNGLKILYHIPYPSVTSADRWIYEGWRDAFLDLGYSFYEFTAFDDLKTKTSIICPDIFMTAVNLLDFSKQIKTLKAIRKNGTKVLVWVDWPMPAATIDAFKSEEIVDLFFGEREPESMIEFERMVGRKYALIPNAANKKVHFPTVCNPKYQYDVVYLGAKLPMKMWFFENVLLPLKKKYSVGIFGPYWTVKDNALRGLAKIAKTLHSQRLVALLNELRIVIPREAENQLYSSAKIALNFHERASDGSQPHYIVNQRAFKIAACGGFQISDAVPALRKYYADDELIMASATDAKDWIAKVEFYIACHQERECIRKKGIERTHNEHTYHNRVNDILSLIGK